MKLNKLKKLSFFAIIIILFIVSILFIKSIYKEKADYERFITIIENYEKLNLSKSELDNDKEKINKEIKTEKNESNLKKLYYSLAKIDFLEENYNEAISNLLKAKTYISSDTGKIDLMIFSALSTNYIYIENTDKSKDYFDKAVKIGLDKKMNDEVSVLYYIRARALLNSGSNIETVIELLEISSKLAVSYENQIRNNLFLSSVYVSNGNYELSIKYNRDALNLAVKNKDKKNINASIINLGENYYIQKEYDKCIYVYEELIKTSRLGNTGNKLTVFGYLMESYSELGNYKKSEEYKDKYLELVRNLKEKDRPRELIWLYMVYSDMKLKQDDLIEAKNYFDKSTSLYEKYKLEAYSGADLYLDKINTEIQYKESNDYEKALTEYKELLNVIKGRGIKSDILYSTLEEIIEISKLNKDYYTTVKYTDELGKSIKKSNVNVSTDDALNSIKNAMYLNNISEYKVQNMRIILISLFLGITLILFHIKNKKIRKLNVQLKELSITDSLTKVFNKRYLYDKLSELYKLEKNVVFVMIDIDYFKLYNDNYGHVKGDEVLVKVASIIKENFKNDFVFRYGGEEFSVVSERSKEDIIIDVKNLRNKLYEANILHEYSSVSDRITMSIGVESSKINSFIDVEKLLSSADKNLYKSKEKGRNTYTY